MHGSPTNFALYQQVAHWQALQNYPQFALYGISQPEIYWAIQVAIDEGPTSWEKNSELLQLLSDSSSNADFSSQNFSWLLDGLHSWQRAIEPWYEHCPWTAPPRSRAEIVSTIHRLCDIYFHSVASRGWLTTAVWLASNDAEEKPSRRCSWCLELLDIVHDNPQERRTLMHRAMEKACPAHLRYQAMRYFPRWIPTSNELRAWLETFAGEEDVRVRFWAAYHLSHMPLDPGQTWIAEALCQGFLENIDREYSASQSQCASYVVDALDRLGMDYLYLGLRHLEQLVTQPKVSRLPFAWRALLNRLHLLDPSNLATMLERWRAALSQEDQALSEAVQAYRTGIRGVLDPAREILYCCNEESHPYYHALRIHTENPWSYDAERFDSMLEVATLIDSFRSFQGLAERLRQMSQTLMELPLEARHLSHWSQMEERLERIVPCETQLRRLASQPSFYRQLAVLTPILCADDVLMRLDGLSPEQ